jgi:hypothetical protein
MLVVVGEWYAAHRYTVWAGGRVFVIKTGGTALTSGGLICISLRFSVYIRNEKPTGGRSY